jgi:hypothetical protein
MMRWVTSAEDLPPGSHSIELYASRPEAARHMASFLKGAKDRHQAAAIFSGDDEMIRLYREALTERAPEMVSALRRIQRAHVRPTAEGLRPIDEVGAFASAHPEGATMCGDTIPSLLNRRTLSSVLAYEDWFDTLRPFYHRGLCPYDLGSFPVAQAPDAFASLAQAHTHVVLSTDPQPASQFLQLLVMPYVENPPEEHLGWLARAVDEGLIQERPDGESGMDLTPRGEVFARALRGLPALTQPTTA